MTRLEEIKRRAETATPGPWEFEGWDNHKRGVVQSKEMCIAIAQWSSHDARFIAHARTDIPLLVAEVERLQSENSAFLEGSAEWEDEARLTKKERDKLKSCLERAMEGLRWYAAFDCEGTTTEDETCNLGDKARAALAAIEKEMKG